MTTPDSTARSDSALQGVNAKSLLADILALDQAIDDFLGDLRTRASWDSANIDKDGFVTLPCGNGVLYRLGEARNRIGQHLPALAKARGDGA